MPRLLISAQRTAEWIEARKGRITASVAAACLRLNPNRSPQSAWREILGAKTEAEAKHDAPDAPPHFGTVFEAEARLAYEAHTGEWVNETGFWVNEDYPFLGASPDGLIGEDGLVEVKCPEFCSFKVACRYRIQMLVQMVVCQRKWCDFWQWGWRAKEFYLERVFPLSETGTRALLKRLREWHERHVVGAEEPPRKVTRRRRKGEVPFWVDATPTPEI